MRSLSVHVEDLLRSREMSTWSEMIPAVLWSLGVLWVPGGLVGAATGLRGIVWLGAAPVLSSGIAGITAVLAEAVQIGWSLSVVAGAAAIVAGFAWGLRRVLALRTGSARGRTGHGSNSRIIVGAATAAGFAFAAFFQARRTVTAIAEPWAVAQTFDTSFHVNAVQQILETGNASSLTMTLTAPGATYAFYPALWHGLVALVAEASGVSAVEATNVMAVAVASAVWPATMIALGRAVFGPDALLLGLIGIASTVFPQFPNRILSYGLLYPNLLSYALLPGVLALAIQSARAHPRRTRLPILAAALLGVAALALAQPNGLFALAVLALPFAVSELVRWSRARWKSNRTLVLSAWAALIGGGVTTYVALGRISLIAEMRESVAWAADTHASRAWQAVFSLSAQVPGGHPAWALALAVIVGAVTAFTRARWVWIPFAYLGVAALYVVARSGQEPLRSELIGYWYGDAFRLAALIPVAGVLLCTMGVGAVMGGLWGLVARWRGQRRPRGHRLALGLGVSLVVAMAGSLALARTPAMRASFVEIGVIHRIADDAGLIDTDEYAIFDIIDQLVPPDSTIVGNPWDGSAVVWAITGREAIFPHLSMSFDPNREIIATSLNQALSDANVCRAIEDLNVRYVLDMGPYLWGGDPAGRDKRYDGLEGVEEVGVARPVARVGDAELLEIVAC